MNAAIIPPEKLAIFDKPISVDKPWIRMGPVKIWSGPYAGSYAVNEAIFDSCEEWEAVESKKRQRFAANGINFVTDLLPSDLINPNIIIP